jgi:hypothetical protein
MGSGAFLVETCRQLGDALVEAWHAYGEVPAIPLDEDEVIFARRLIAQRCLYGLDRNAVAVDLAKVSLWLATLAKEHALTFVDHALRHGDSLVGLSLRQIEAFHWDPDAPRFQAGFESMHVREHVMKIDALRRKIREATDSASDQELRDLWDVVQREIGEVRLFGDLVLAAYFEGDKPTEREAKRKRYASSVASGEAERYRSELDKLRHADQPFAPFHWEIEFPEVFEDSNPGFDSFVGNPPFMGGTKISSMLGAPYLHWILKLNQQASGSGDLVAHFFRRAFDLVRNDGTLGMIATNTIGQGDTRITGLQWICQHGGEIFAVRKRLKWPGLAAVIVSVVHIMKGVFQGQKRIDAQTVDRITAFLFHRGGDDNPTRLSANTKKSFNGTKVYGMGFTFDDTDKTGVASPLSEMSRLIEKASRNQEVIFPYIGGEEVNTSPTHAHHRFVINFGERTEEECRQKWPDLMTIVQTNVKPERDQLDDNPDGRRRKQYWWQFGRSTPALNLAIAQHKRVCVICRHQPQWAVTLMASSCVFAESLIVFPLSSYAAFCCLQSRTHETWARFFGSSIKDDLRYTPSDCFETFPFPKDWQNHPVLEVAGKPYYEFRSALMIKNNQGLTKIYNRFHDPDECDSKVLKLREMHSVMDRAVLDAYGWSDIPIHCDFLLDYEIDEEEWGNKKKPYRYRWPDDIRDEVLARLLELNAKRAREEELSGVAVPKGVGKKAKAKSGSKQRNTQDLFA